MARKYNSNEERIRAAKEQKNKYSMKEWECIICDCVVKLGNKSNHLKTKKHFNYAHGILPPSSDKMWSCDVCDIVIKSINQPNHLASDRHLRNEEHINNALTEQDRFIENSFGTKAENDQKSKDDIES
jgi:hypothetical protein